MHGPRVLIVKRLGHHVIEVEIITKNNVCSYSYLSGIYDDNQQESRSDTKQHWGIFVVSGLFPWSAVCCYLMGHKQCKHQDFQQPGSQWIHAEGGIQKGFGNVVYSCNFVICTVKYTHTCALSTGFKLVIVKKNVTKFFILSFILKLLQMICLRKCDQVLWIFIHYTTSLNAFIYMDFFPIVQFPYMEFQKKQHLRPISLNFHPLCNFFKCPLWLSSIMQLFQISSII